MSETQKQLFIISDFQVYFLQTQQANSNNLFQKKISKVDLAHKIVVFSMLCGLPMLMNSTQRFGMTKPQHITYIHQRFEDFSPNSFGAIKVYYKSNRFKDGVYANNSTSGEHINASICSLHAHRSPCDQHANTTLCDQHANMWSTC